MATQTTVTLIDDITGSKAAETIAFGLDGGHYEIDLNATNARKLRAALAPYVDRGRQQKKPQPATKPATTRHSREHLQAVRDWARRQGYEVADRGRVHAHIMAAFDAAH